MAGREAETSTAVLDPADPASGAGGDVAGSTAPTSMPASTVPQRADGLQLLGEFEESGFEDPPSLVRRADGQVVQLTELLFVTLQAVDGQRDLDAIAAEVSSHLGRTATADNVRFLLDKKLRPMGVLKGPHGEEPQLKKASPLLALRFRFVMSSERLTNRITAPFAQLFRRPIVIVVIAAFIAVSTWVMFLRGVAQGTREALYSPGLLLLIFGLTILSAGFHEFGHASACRYGGARPGVMGAGIYLVWPAFYTDVTDAYRLGRAGRLRTDLGGLYFNALFLLGVFGAWAATGHEAFLIAVPLQLFQMMHQLLPFIRMDGYYILSDLTGVPDLFARIKPTLTSALPGTDTDERAARLKRWVRVVVTLWVLIVLPVLLLSMLIAAISLPRLLATAWDSLGIQWRALTAAAGDGRWLAVVGGAVSTFALILPVAASTYMVIRITRRVVIKARTWAAGHPLRQFAVAGATIAVTVGLVALWWPNGEYRPIQPGERGTVIDGVEAAADVTTGRPGLTEEREAELGGAPGATDQPTATETTPTSTLPTTTAPSDASDAPSTTSTSSSAPTSTTTTDTTPDTTSEPPPDTTPETTP